VAGGVERTGRGGGLFLGGEFDGGHLGESADGGGETLADIFGLPKLPARYASLVLPFFLTCVMTCVVSGISTFRVAGIGPDVLGTWLLSWGLSWAVAYPTMLLVLPSVKKLVAALVASE
jgi:hypothetical protein